MNGKGLSNAQQLKNSIDRHLLPKEPETVGEDWRGEDVYRDDRGYFIEGEFVREEDVREYISSNYLIRKADVYFS